MRKKEWREEEGLFMEVPRDGISGNLSKFQTSFIIFLFLCTKQKKKKFLSCVLNLEALGFKACVLLRSNFWGCLLSSIVFSLSRF